MTEKQDISVETGTIEASPLKDEQQPNGKTTGPSTLTPTVKAWLLLFVHGSICLSLALSVALAVNGYEALDPSIPRRTHKKLILRVSDITTLISAALVIVKLFVSSWSTLMVWACGHYLLSRGSSSTSSTQVSFMMRWKLPPWLLQPLKISATSHNWVISLGLLLVLCQAFLAPILSGSVNWKTSVVSSDKVTMVNSTDPNAAFSIWYWYNAQGSFDKRAYLRQAAGYASIAWADSTAVLANGTSRTGNGCRSVINDNGLPVNSTLAGAVVPCIDIHSINWYKSASDVSKAESDLIYKSDDLSVVGDSPFSYYRPGAGVVFDPRFLRKGPGDTKVKPPSAVWTGNGPNGVKTIGLMIKRQDTTKPACTNLNPTSFGDVDTHGYYFLGGPDTGDQNCFLVGTINFTAGVTTSKESKYISHRVVEDQTPLKDVVFQPSPWVQEAIWLLPDLMTMISVMNSSQLPTYNNINGYVELLVRQAYLAAFDMLHNSFDMKGPMYQATSVEPRLKAEVSFVRVYVWLGLCLLMPVSGILLMMFVLRREDLITSEDLGRENKEAANAELLGLAFSRAIQ